MQGLTLNYNPLNYTQIKFIGVKHDDSIRNLTPPRGMEKILIPIKNRVNRIMPNMVEVLFAKRRK